VAAKAELLAARGEHEEAIKLIEEAEQEELDPRPLALARARVLLSAGDASEERLEATRKQLEEAAKEQGLGAMDLGDLLRAIGRINDRFGRYDDAFGSFRRAAKLRRGNYDPRSHTMMTTKIIQDWTVQNMSKIVRPEESGEKFAFVVGAPKSGAGELADMLGQIEGVRVLGPLETLAGECVRHLSARQGVLRPVPLEPQQIRGGQLREAAAGYRAQADGLGASDAQRAIDTHPLNIPLLGAAALMFPGVQIVMCRRDPIECTLACYCQAMPGNHPYAGDLLNAAGFVADCNRMMEHWAKVLSALEPGANIVQVHYADLASDPKRAAVKIAQEIGIDAKGEDIERVPELGTGPASHTEHYQSYLKQIRDLFTPAAKA